MKTLRLIRTANQCGLLLVILSLAAPQPLLAQAFYSALRPEVILASPANHATFYAPADIALFAYARSSAAVGLLGMVTNVVFFANNTNLGSGYDLGSAHATLRPVYGNFVIARAMPALGSMYCLVWTNAPPGTYTLTARTQDHGVLGMGQTSAPVHITILAATTNPNPTDRVSVVATDPMAIAGTNAYWVWSGMTNVVPAWTNWPPPRWAACTNWGPKNALFTVRRFGDASADLTVNFDLSGTASNGLDYATLTNCVTIPAGEAYAHIPIVPMDVARTNASKTVILTLAPDTNTPPDYLVDFPRQAAALIQDNWPRPLPWLLPDGCFHVNVPGPDGAWFVLQNSSDLENWTSVVTNQVFQGAIDFIDADAPNHATGFYRTLPLANAPAN